MLPQEAFVQQTMTAVVYGGKNDIRLEQRPLPSLQHPGDAIVKVMASSICASDLHIRNGAVPRAREGVILGHEFAGEVVAVGKGVKKLRVGDRVAANVETFCGQCFFCKRGYVNNCVAGGWELGCRIDGCQTEYVRVPFADNGLNAIPDSLSYESVVLVGDVLATGYFGASLVEIRPGDTVAVIGSGPVGLVAMMCARLYGPAHIVASDPVPQRLDVARRHGLADHTVHVPREDLCHVVRQLTDGRGADAVIECAGGADTFQTAWQAARPNAVVSVMALYEEAQSLPLHQMYGKNLTFKTGGVNASHSDELIRLMAAGKLDTAPLITHRFRLQDIMEAYALFEHHPESCIKACITPDAMPTP